jgi:3',5'-cyclic AMP phosphodiesterase CpdA
MHAVGRNRRGLDGRRRRARIAADRLGESSGEHFSFVQISDSHIGFAKPANPDARVTLNAAIDKIVAMPDKPAFMIHTGDISHAAKANEFDDAQQMIGRAKLDVHYAPDEHDILDPKTRDVYLERFGKGATGGGWYSFDEGGVHFVSLNNVVDLKKNGLGSHPTLDDRARMGLGHRGFGAGAWASLALRLGDRAQRPRPSIDAEDRRQRHVPHRALNRLSAAGAQNGACARTEARACRRIAQMARRPTGRLCAHADQPCGHRF